MDQRHVEQDIQANQAQVAGRDFHHHEHHHYYAPSEQDIVRALRLKTLREKELVDAFYCWVALGVFGLVFLHALVVWLAKQMGIGYASAWLALLLIVAGGYIVLNWLTDKMVGVIDRLLGK